MVVLGGFIQGVYTIGGPFVLMGYKDHFTSKQELVFYKAGRLLFYHQRSSCSFLYFIGGSYMEIVAEYYPIAFEGDDQCLVRIFSPSKNSEVLFKKLIIIAILLIGIIILVTK